MVPLHQQAPQGRGQLCPVVGAAMSGDSQRKDTRTGTGMAHHGTPHQAGMLVRRGASRELEGLCSRYKVISLNIYLVVHLFYFFL